MPILSLQSKIKIHLLLLDINDCSWGIDNFKVLKPTHWYLFLLLLKIVQHWNFKSQTLRVIMQGKTNTGVNSYLQILFQYLKSENQFGKKKSHVHKSCYLSWFSSVLPQMSNSLCGSIYMWVYLYAWIKSRVNSIYIYIFYMFHWFYDSTHFLYFQNYM